MLKLLRLAILHDLNRKEEAKSAHVAGGDVFGFEGFELLANIGLELGGALDELEALHFLDGGDCGSESERVGFVSVAVGEVVVFEVVGDLGCGGAEAERYIGRGDALGGDENIGLEVASGRWRTTCLCGPIRP